MIEFLLVPAAVALAFGLQIRDMTRGPKAATVTLIEPTETARLVQPQLYAKVPQGLVRVREMDFTRAEWQKIVAAVAATDDQIVPRIIIRRGPHDA